VGNSDTRAAKAHDCEESGNRGYQFPIMTVIDQRESE